jgi:uncharacterized integral membrane protein
MMRIRVLPALLVLLLTGLFALINWTSFSTPTTLNLGFMMVTAPLGLVMLGIVTLLAVMNIASVVYLQSVALIEGRRLGRELEAQRALADKAEASRFTELRDFFQAETDRTQRLHDELRGAIFARLEQMEQRSRAVMEANANSLSAYIGQLEDRLEHRTLPPDVPPAARPDYRGAPR